MVEVGQERSPARKTLDLSAGPLRLVLSPPIGGSIAQFDYLDGDRRIPILRGCPGDLDHVLAAASFPLVPYVNRIRGGAFTFRGEDIRLQPNMAGDPSPLHGQGWLGPWSVEESSVDRAVLSFEHQAGEWPWAYAARQTFGLTPTSLEIELACRNQSDRPMPCGLGQHPYFLCSADTRLRTRVEHAWTIDDHVLPLERVPATGQFDLADRAVCGLGLDHGFDGWGGQATICDPDWPFDLRLSSPTAHFFQLYSPASGGIFVAEPVTHANAALNLPEDQWAAHGMRILAPGEELSLIMRLDLD